MIKKILGGSKLKLLIFKIFFWQMDGSTQNFFAFDEYNGRLYELYNYKTKSFA